MKRKNRKGFTIIELVVVAVILSMLAVFVVPKTLQKLGKAKKSITKAQIASISQQIMSFQIDCGVLPTDLEDLLEAPDGMEEKWGPRPYLKESELLDPWGNPYQYAEDSTNVEGFVLISFGADGEEGGEGDNEDILND